MVFPDVVAQLPELLRLVAHLLPRLVLLLQAVHPQPPARPVAVAHAVVVVVAAVVASRPSL